METGDESLLRYLHKPGQAVDVVDAVSALKATGMAVSVTIMTGIGGDRFDQAHVAGTVASLNAMPLGAGDIVYFSPFIDHQGSEYGRRAAVDGIRPLNEAEVVAQEAAIRAGFRF
jgi:radical SAM superfamily enzyme YgiQ (UPF0313 family)